MMDIDDEIEARIVAAVEGYDKKDVFAALSAMSAKMILCVTNGNEAMVSRTFRECADFWDSMCRGSYH